MYLVHQCDHFYNNQETAEGREQSTPDAMRSIQTRSAIILFLLVHIPLSRVSSAFSLLTGILGMALNLRTKYWFYRKANNLVCFIFGSLFKENLLTIRNHVRIENYLRYADELRQKQDLGSVGGK